MTVWGKIVGGTAGLLLGGPLGGLIGMAAGHAYDHYADIDVPLPTEDEAVKSVAFTVGVIALSAKMARADGEVTRPEMVAFREIHRVDPGEEANVQRLFDLARKHSEGFEAYARQIAKLFTPASPVLEELLGGLAHIARADGQIHPSELEYLREVATIFGFDGAAFNRIIRSHLGEEACLGDPWCVLGVTFEADESALRTAYHRLVKENHPDSLMAQGLPAEAVALATEKLAAINAAYAAVKRMRGEENAA